MKQTPLFLLGLLLGSPLFAQTTPTSTDAVTEISKDTSVLQMITNAGWVMAPLALASVITITLIITAFFTLTKRSITTPELLQRMEPFFENEDLAGLAAYVSERPQATARIVDHVLRFLERHPDADAASISAVAEVEASRFAATMNQRVTYIMDVGVVAPLLGLFGTVVGVLNSFGHIAQDQGPMRTLLLAGGVSQALIATASGLVVGITAMAFYAYFRGKLNGLISLLEVEATLLTQEIILLSRRHRPVVKTLTK